MILRVRGRIRRRTGGCWGWDSVFKENALRRGHGDHRGHRAEQQEERPGFPDRVGLNSRRALHGQVRFWREIQTRMKWDEGYDGNGE